MVATIGVGARGKGRLGEHEVKIILKSILAPVYFHHSVELPEFERNLEQSRGGGYDLKGLEWLAIEVKRQERSNLKAWWEQTIKQTQKHQIPFLIHRANHQPWRVRTIVPVVIAPLASELYSEKVLSLTVDLEPGEWEEWLKWECHQRLRWAQSENSTTDN